MSKWKQKLLFIYFFRSFGKTEWKLSFWADFFNDLLRVPGMVPGQPQRASLAPPLEQKEQQWNVPLWRLNFLFTFRRNGEPCRARRERVGRWVSVDTRPTLSHCHICFLPKEKFVRMMLTALMATPRLSPTSYLFILTCHSHFKT